jgi:hypothetical protein
MSEAEPVAILSFLATELAADHFLLSPRFRLRLSSNSSVSGCSVFGAGFGMFLAFV